MYKYLSLQDTPLEQLASCFNLAFSDYEQPIHFTPESFKYYITASAVDLSLSFGAFYNGELVALILNSYGIYEGKAVVYDAGTGVVPEHRGKKVFSQLFEYTVQQLHDHSINKYYLEVLQANTHAITIYTKKRFHIRREYSVLIASGAETDTDASINIMQYPDFQSFPTTHSVAPSFEHTTHTISRNPDLYEVRSLDGEAYCIYAKRNGEIIQMHYNDLNALKNVMIAITRQYPSAFAKNVDFNYPDVLQMLKEIGFKEITKQFEMVREI